jgi:hypothetical protein
LRKLQLARGGLELTKDEQAAQRVHEIMVFIASRFNILEAYTLYNRTCFALWNFAIENYRRFTVLSGISSVYRQCEAEIGKIVYRVFRVFTPIS